MVPSSLSQHTANVSDSVSSQAMSSSSSSQSKSSSAPPAKQCPPSKVASSNSDVKSAQSKSIKSSTVKSSAITTSNVQGSSVIATKTKTTSKHSRHGHTRKSRHNRPQPFVPDANTVALLRKNNYEIKERLGGGAFSEVFRAVNITKTDRDFAAKIIDLSAMNEKYHTKFLPRELQNLCKVRHPNIIRIYDIIRMMNRIFIFMERAVNGDMAKYLKTLHRPMEEPAACKWFHQMTSALYYMHIELKMAHRDLKIDNILISAENEVKLADFGFSLQVLESADNEGPQLSRTFCGTRPYLCPQIICKQAYNPFKADIWALGVVLFAMLNNRYPFHYKDRKSMLREQLDREYIPGRFTSELSAAARNLLLAMFEPAEEARITIEKIVEHEWMQLYVAPVDEEEDAE